MTSSPTAVAGGEPFTLPDVRTLTDAPTITRLLHSTIAHERQTLTHLSTLLTPSPSSPIPFPSSLPSLSSSLLSSLSSTADLALSSTATVRRLHLAISRLDEALSFLDRSVVRSRCLKVAREAVEVEDLETAAEAVREFVGTGPGDGERERIEEVRKHVEGSARKRVREAVERREHKDVVRYLEIFPKLGLEEDALQIYVSYLRNVIADRSSFDFESEKDVDFVGCLTGLFKDVVLAVEENDGMLRGFCGEHGIVYAVCELQEVCDSKGSVIVKKYMEYRKLSKLAAEINSYSKSLLLVGVGGEMKGPDPRIVENYLEEILTLTQLGEDYTEFMVAKIKGLTSVDPELGPKVIRMLRNGSFSRVVQDITGFYVILEEFFMVENVRKAIAIDEQIPDSLTTSMVDDVFYVLQSCCRRAVSTGNANSVLAVLSGVVNLLGNEYQEALQQKMREPNLGAKLFMGGVGVQKTGTEVATALNNMDVSSEYVLKLRHEIEEQCSEMFPLPADREKVKSCITELGEMSNNLKQVLYAGLEQLLTTITPRIRPVLDNVGTISYELTESEYEDYEVNDPWVQNVLHAVEINIAWLQPVMTTNNYDSLVHLVIDFIVKRLEVIMMQKRFSPLGSLQLDRDTRALVNHFYNMTQRPVRDKFARLTQMTTILNIEKVSEILDFWGENSGTMTWRLTPAEVRRVLGLRIDFKPEAIAALKL